MCHVLCSVRAVFLLSSILLGCCFYHGVLGYSRGAPRSRCENMLPSHGRTATIKRYSQPYEITVSGDGTYDSDQRLTVTLKGINKRFKGFLLQARSTSGGTDMYGTFTPERYKTTNVCGRAGLTHLIGSRKDEIQATWKAPYQPVGDIMFVATVVEDYRTIWMNVTSAPLRDNERLMKENIRQLSVSIPVNSTLEACAEGELLPLRDHLLPQVAILCNAHAQCPCTWRCCPLCDDVTCTPHAICRQPKENITLPEDTP